jgi:hypothetical protein
MSIKKGNLACLKQFFKKLNLGGYQKNLVWSLSSNPWGDPGSLSTFTAVAETR